MAAALLLAISIGHAELIVGFIIGQPLGTLAGYDPDGYTLVPGAILIALPLAAAATNVLRRTAIQPRPTNATPSSRPALTTPQRTQDIEA